MLYEMCSFLCVVGNLLHMWFPDVSSLPISGGGAEICNITFFDVKGVKNVILQFGGKSREK